MSRSEGDETLFVFFADRRHTLMSLMSTGSAGESMIDRKSLGISLNLLYFKLLLRIEITAAIVWYDDTAHARPRSRGLTFVNKELQYVLGACVRT